MEDFVYIPITAMFCYIFLFMTLIAAKKNNIINGFLIVLGSMILWTSGSFFMRIQLWPSVKFWYDISISGLLLLVYALFNFACEYTKYPQKIYKFIWGTILFGIGLINILTGVFLKVPTHTIGPSGVSVFVYDTTWTVSFLFLFCLLPVIQMMVIFFRYYKCDELSRRQLSPVFLGMAIILLGHIGFLFPFLKGFPTDILSGLIAAICMFYALYKRRLFRLTLLVSRGSCYAISGALSIVLLMNMVVPIESFIRSNLRFLVNYSAVIIALSFTALIFLICFIINKFIDAVFTKEEVTHAENLKKFSVAISKSLEIDEILEDLVDIIQKTVPVKRVYICIGNNEDDSFKIAHSTSPLDEKTFFLHSGNPIISWLKNNDGCLLMKDFRRTIGYRSIWEDEKKQINDLNIECLVPLKDENELVGIILLSGKEHGATYTYDNLNFFSSINSIASIAVKNSRLYQKAYLEARIDELTGLLNRKYFYQTLNCEYEKCKDSSLSLIIFNIDDFKLYNQLYGNKEGDKALQKVAIVLKSSVGDSGYVARYSGKEFAVILPNCDPLTAKNLVSNVTTQIFQMNQGKTDYSMKPITMSVGICASPYVAHNVQQLVQYADLAVYNVKRSGKNAVMLYTNDSNEQSERNKSEQNKIERVYSEYANTIFALTAAIDTKDHYTFSHSKNVSYYSSEIAFAMGMNSECVEIVKEAALLHDIGKIGVPEHILNKPGKLTDEEYNTMKGHVDNSIGIIKHLPSLDYVVPAVMGHHERYDGRGYPRGIAGEEIPIMARILCVADSFDAMVSKRTYKASFEVEYAVAELKNQSNKQFDPEIVNIFISLIEKDTVKIIIE